jgi:hypothetical protein
MKIGTIGARNIGGTWKATPRSPETFENPA